MKLRELDVRVRATSPLKQDELKSLNGRAFVVCEAVRLALREVRPEASCVKLLVELATPGSTEPTGPYVIDGICEVRVPLNLGKALAAPDLSPVIAAARQGVVRSAEHLGGGANIILALLDEIESSRPPCNFKFSRMSRVHRKSATGFSVWFRADIGRFEVVVEAARGSRVWPTTVCASEAPIYLEDDFPMKDAVVVGDEFIIRNRERRPLARVPVPGD